MTRRATKRVPVQGKLPLRDRPTWGGRRKGAGRKPGPRARVPHRTRAAHSRAHPLHVTLRARPEVGSLRAARVFPHLRAALARASRDTFRVIHFSVQGDHVHLLVEADGAEALTRGLWGLSVRVARAINRARARRGRVWADRYHAHELTTPREVRNALVYVLLNWKKHRREAMGIDPCSSGLTFDGWRGGRVLEVGDSNAVVPSTAPRTWLLRVGWRRHGLLDVDEHPTQARRAR